MRLDSISQINSLKTRQLKLSKVNDPAPIEKPLINMIVFKSGNPKHVLHQISESQLLGFMNGGVGTVGNDFLFLDKGFDKIVQNVPIYNQEVKYVKDIDPLTNAYRGMKKDGVTLRKIPTGLPADHPFKANEGSVFVTSKEIKKGVDLKEFLSIADNAKSVFVLDEIQTSKMQWGLEKDVPIGIYKVKKDDKFLKLMRNQGFSEEQINKIDITLTYVDSTASMAKQYADGSYASASGTDTAKKLSAGWQGKPYPKEAKATAELLPALKENLGGFDPKYITCHDGQAMPLSHFVAVKNASGDQYWKDKVVTAIGHNLNDGYVYSMSTKDAIVCLGTPDEIKKIINSRQYIEALKTGTENEFLKSLLPKQIFDSRGNISAAMFPIVYAEKGFVPMFTTVSENYYKSIIENELVSPSVHKRLQELSNLGRFRGIVNMLADPNATGFTINGLQAGYKEDTKIKLKNGKEIIIEKFKAFNETKKYDLKDMREIKRYNKINLLKRLNNEFKDAQLWDSKSNKYLEANTGFSQVVTGGTGRKFNIIGEIDPKYIKALESGKDVPMFVSWGRGDFQKGMDTGLEAFVKFVKKTGDKDSIYVFGGDMTELKDVVTLTKDLNKDPLLKGRVLLLDGWTPGGSFAAAGDYAVLPSRFAPCELTDLEAMKKGCIPIVPKVQGMDQKVIDIADTARAGYRNGYKGAHEYYMTEADAFKAANKENQEIFTNAKNEIVKKLKNEYAKTSSETMPTELLENQLKSNDTYNKALQKLRDSVISDDISSCMERAIKDRNTKTAEEIWKNHVDLKTLIDDNGWMSSTKKSTGELYKELHYSANGKNLTEGEVLKLDLSKLTDSGLGEGSGVSFGSKIKTFFKSKKGKWTAGIAGAVALGGAAYGLLKSKKNNSAKPVEPKTVNKPKSEVNSVNISSVEKTEDAKHLSAVV